MVGWVVRLVRVGDEVREVVGAPEADYGVLDRGRCARFPRACLPDEEDGEWGSLGAGLAVGRDGWREGGEVAEFSGEDGPLEYCS